MLLPCGPTGRRTAARPETEALHAIADGFRNYYHPSNFMAPEEALIDKAQLLRLSAPEMTVLAGGRVHR